MTAYVLHGIVVSRDTLDPETRRYVTHAPKAELLLQVGARSKFVEIELTEGQLILLIQQAAKALEVLR